MTLHLVEAVIFQRCSGRHDRLVVAPDPSRRQSVHTQLNVGPAVSVREGKSTRRGEAQEKVADYYQTRLIMLLEL